MNATALHTGSAQAARIGQTRDGVVSAVDPTSHAVRVRLEPDGQETGWIPDAPLAAGGMRIACPSEIGTAVKVMPTDGSIENAVIVGRVFDTVVTPPVSPMTGKPAQPGELLIMAGQGAGPLTDGGSVGAATAGAGWLHVTAGGVFMGAGGTTLAITSTGVAVTGPLTGTATAVFQGNVTGGGIDLDTHRHAGVQPGSGTTQGPVG